MKLIVIFGPPSVGKTTIGKLIEARTNFKLFHNHMVMDGIMHMFGVGTPAENRLSKIVRTEVIKEAAASEIDLIFTYVWDFSQVKGKANIDTYKEIYENRGGEVFFIELSAPLDVRIERANSPDRQRIKTHAPDAKRVAQLETSLSLTSPSPFFYPDNYTKIDTVNKNPKEVAQES